jgi:hypothetical protein
MSQSSNKVLQSVISRYVLAVRDQYLASGQTLDVDVIIGRTICYSEVNRPKTYS